MTNDSSIQVRYQLAFTLGEVRHTNRIEALAAITRRDAGDSWVRAAVLSSLTEGTGEMFHLITTPARPAPAASPPRGVSSTDANQPFLRELVQVIGARNQSNEVAAVLAYVANASDPALAFSLVHSLGEGLRRARASLPAGNLQTILTRARELATDSRQPETARVQAIELLGLTSFAESSGLLLSLLSLNEAQSVQLAAIETLGRFSDPKVGLELMQRWPSLTPRLREETLPVLLARPDRAAALMKAVEAGVLRRSDLSSTQIEFLANHRDAQVRAQAIKLLLNTSTATRQMVVDAFQSALKLAGDPVHGREIFQKLCISCHRLAGEGFVLGPDLVSVRNAGKEKMLISILDPSREVLPQYLAYEIETKDDETLMGVLMDENAGSVTLRQAYAKDTVIPRANIASVRSRGISIMPDELEASLQPQDIADLLEFIGTAEK
jgi:putative heme-binding domain-containing protein